MLSAAPLERASKDKAPLPANKSRQTAPSIAGESQLNSVSRTRLGVGRSPLTGANSKTRLRHWPAIILNLEEEGGFPGLFFTVLGILETKRRHVGLIGLIIDNYSFEDEFYSAKGGHGTEKTQNGRVFVRYSGNPIINSYQ